MADHSIRDAMDSAMGDSQPSRFDHYAWIVTMVADVAVLVGFFTTFTTNAAVATGGAVLIGAGVVFMLFGMRSDWRHSRHLCDKCIEKWPLDPQAQVQKRMGSLRRYHWLADNPRRSVGVSAAIVAIEAVVVLWAPRIVFGVVAVVVLLVWTPLQTWTNRVHSRLQPWCPWCHHRDDGGETFEPEPDPEMSKERDRV